MNSIQFESLVRLKQEITSLTTELAKARAKVTLIESAVNGMPAPMSVADVQTVITSEMAKQVEETIYLAGQTTGTTTTVNLLKIKNQAEIAIPLNKALYVRLFVVAIATTGTNINKAAYYEFNILTKNINGVGTLLAPTSGRSASNYEEVTGWGVVISVIGTTLRIACTGDTLGNVSWMGRAILVSV